VLQNLEFKNAADLGYLISVDFAWTRKKTTHWKM